MKIVIDAKSFTITPEQSRILTQGMRGRITIEYDKLEPQWRLAAKAIARGCLSWIENRVEKEAGMEAAKATRPAKGADPVPHLLMIGEKLLGDMLKHVTVSFCTAEDGTIENFTATISQPGKDQSRAGGSLGPDGHIGVGQDDGIEVFGSDVHASV